MVDKSEKHLIGCEAVLLRQVRRLAGSWQFLILGSTPGIVAGSQEAKFRLNYVIHSCRVRIEEQEKQSRSSAWSLGNE
jgi:hypothetical protein